MHPHMHSIVFLPMLGASSTYWASIWSVHLAWLPTYISIGKWDKLLWDFEGHVNHVDTIFPYMIKCRGTENGFNCHSKIGRLAPMYERVRSFPPYGHIHLFRPSSEPLLTAFKQILIHKHAAVIVRGCDSFTEVSRFAITASMDCSHS